MTANLLCTLALVLCLLAPAILFGDPSRNRRSHPLTQVVLTREAILFGDPSRIGRSHPLTQVVPTRAAILFGDPSRVPREEIARPAVEATPLITLRRKIDRKSGLPFIVLPKGSYPAVISDPKERLSNDIKSGNTVTIPSLLFGQTDVTVAAYIKCVQAGACSRAPEAREEDVPRCTWKNGLLSHPLNCVTWSEAVDFCKWVGGRLPTSTDWEYAATSGVKDRTYPWGEANVDGRRANYCDINCVKALGTDKRDGKNLAKWEKAGWIDRTQNDGWAATSPVGSYPLGATTWGLLDMAGNVWQWTSSQAGPDQREVRGGSWDNAPASLKIQRRFGWPEKAADAGMGFRCVKDV